MTFASFTSTDRFGFGTVPEAASSNLTRGCNGVGAIHAATPLGLASPRDVPLEAQSVEAIIEPVEFRLGRLIDAGFAASALFILLPVFVVICLAIWIQDRGPPIFAHRRIGRGGKPFPCLKFRTMVKDAEHRLACLLESDPSAAEEWQRRHKLRDDPRITPIGGFLRKTSLDEIPQLLNVLIGQMSLVGPRPIVEKEIPHYGRYFVHYCRVRPGITGLWQVSGRSNLSYRRRVVIDTVYCRSKSLALDLAILTRTVPVVLTGRGAS